MLVRHHDHLACTAQGTAACPARGWPHVQACGTQRRDPKLAIVRLTHTQGRLVGVDLLIETVEWTHLHDTSVHLTADHVSLGFVVGDSAQCEGACFLLG